MSTQRLTEILRMLSEWTGDRQVLARAAEAHTALTMFVDYWPERYVAWHRRIGKLIYRSDGFDTAIHAMNPERASQAANELRKFATAALAELLPAERPY